MSRVDALPADDLLAVDFTDQLRPLEMVYFLLDVGDGDSQLLLLPEDAEGHRAAVVVDVASAPKVLGLVSELEAAGLLRRPSQRRRFPLVVATHPHQDHIRGLPRLLRKLGDDIEELWHPGYYTANRAFVETMAELDATRPGPRPRVVLPTSGTVRHLGPVTVTVLSPSVGLRSRFDTHGVDVNDASITVMVEYPAGRVLRPDQPGAPRRTLPRRTSRRLLLGADAQHASWAQVTIDFPALRPDRSWIARHMAERGLLDQLRADVLKVPHHASKHGTTLELVERVRPALCLVSSVTEGGHYGFPHAMAMEALREARQPTAATGRNRNPDWDLGIHVTGARDTAGRRLGSIAVVVPPTGRMRLLRFGDGPGDVLALANAREWRP